MVSVNPTDQAESRHNWLLKILVKNHLECHLADSQHCTLKLQTPRREGSANWKHMPQLAMLLCQFLMREFAKDNLLSLELLYGAYALLQQNTELKLFYRNLFGLEQGMPVHL